MRLMDCRGGQERWKQRINVSGRQDGSWAGSSVHRPPPPFCWSPGPHGAESSAPQDPPPTWLHSSEWRKSSPVTHACMSFHMKPQSTSQVRHGSQVLRPSEASHSPSRLTSMGICGCLSGSCSVRVLGRRPVQRGPHVKELIALAGSQAG